MKQKKLNIKNAGRKKQGDILYRRIVTAPQKEKLDVLLKDMRNDKGATL